MESTCKSLPKGMEGSRAVEFWWQVGCGILTCHSVYGILSCRWFLGWRANIGSASRLANHLERLCSSPVQCCRTRIGRPSRFRKLASRYRSPPPLGIIAVGLAGLSTFSMGGSTPGGASRPLLGKLRQRSRLSETTLASPVEPGNGPDCVHWGLHTLGRKGAAWRGRNRTHGASYVGYRLVSGTDLQATT